MRCGSQLLCRPYRRDDTIKTDRLSLEASDVLCSARGMLLCMAIALACAACQRSVPGTPATLTGAAAAATSAHDSRPGGVAWFEGDIAQAFDRAQQQRKPVFVYFGAVWCPPCQELKATIFHRRDFLDRLTLYVPVYLDGDAPDAQRWADRFHVTGYPTVLILRSDHSEIERVTGGMDLARYAEVLEIGITALHPMQQILTSVRDSDRPLDLTDCRILAYNGWQDDDAWIFSDEHPQALQQLTKLLARAADQCPTSASVERSRLEVTVAAADAQLEEAALKSRKAPSPTLAAAVEQVRPLLAEPVAQDIGDTLLELPQPFFAAAARLHPADRMSLEQTFAGLMDGLARDPRYSSAMQLFAVAQKITAVQALEPSGKVPAAMAAQARERAERVLSQAHEPYARTSAVDAVDALLQALGDTQRRYELLLGESRTSATPFYYQSELGDLEEQRGHPDAAVDWYARSYRGSQGQATRIQWGSGYVRALIRLRPNDEEAIRSTTLQLLAGFQNTAAIHGRTRHALDRLFAALHGWNRAGTHAAAVACIRIAMERICRSGQPGTPDDSAGSQVDACSQMAASI